MSADIFPAPEGIKPDTGLCLGPQPFRQHAVAHVFNAFLPSARPCLSPLVHFGC